jgi:Cupin domain.
MGYQVVDPETVTPVDGRPCELRRLSAATELSNIAINKFHTEPGEQLPLAYHYHESQQEAFYILHGTLSVETPTQIITVETGELLTVDTESPQRSYNSRDAEEDVVALAVGAPAVDDDVVAYDPETEN